MLDKIFNRYHNINTVFKSNQINNKLFKKLKYIKSGSTGHTFKGTIYDDKNDKYIECAFKIVAYTIKPEYGDPDNSIRPENTELRMIKLLSSLVLNNKPLTPHIILPIKSFRVNIKNFLFKNIEHKNYKDFLEKYKKKQFYSDVSVLINEWADNGDLLMFLKKNYRKLDLKFWKTIFFQLLFTLAKIHELYPSFRHNDLKANNILISSFRDYSRELKKEYFCYRINKNDYCIPYIGYIIGIWDFDFACIPGKIDNLKVSAQWTKRINVNPEQNKYYDTHYFFNTLIKKGFLPEIMTSSKVPKEVGEFINRIIPIEYQRDKKYLSEKGRILINIELFTPLQIIENDPFFKEFQFK